MTERGASALCSHEQSCGRSVEATMANRKANHRRALFHVKNPMEISDSASRPMQCHPPGRSDGSVGTGEGEPRNAAVEQTLAQTVSSQGDARQLAG